MILERITLKINDKNENITLSMLQCILGLSSLLILHSNRSKSQCLLLLRLFSLWAVMPYSVPCVVSSLCFGPELSIQCTGRFKTSPFCAYWFTDGFWNWRSTLALFFRLKPNASSNQFFRDWEILNNPAINVRRREQPNASKLKES